MFFVTRVNVQGKHILRAYFFESAYEIQYYTQLTSLTLHCKVAHQIEKKNIYDDRHSSASHHDHHHRHKSHVACLTCIIIISSSSSSNAE